jgi:hypothetical protein
VVVVSPGLDITAQVSFVSIPNNHLLLRSFTNEQSTHPTDELLGADKYTQVNTLQPANKLLLATHVTTTVTNYYCPPFVVESNLQVAAFCGRCCVVVLIV